MHSAQFKRTKYEPLNNQNHSKNFNIEITLFMCLTKKSAPTY